MNWNRKLTYLDAYLIAVATSLTERLPPLSLMRLSRNTLTILAFLLSKLFSSAHRLPFYFQKSYTECRYTHARVTIESVLLQAAELFNTTHAIAMVAKARQQKQSWFWYKMPHEAKRFTVDSTNKEKSSNRKGGGTPTNKFSLQ